MSRKQYVLDTDDKRLIDDARHAVAGGSIRKLAKVLHRSEPYLRHVLAGRAKSLDYATRQRLQHLIVREQVKGDLIGVFGDRWETRIAAVMDHMLTCEVCLATAVVESDKHFKQTVVDRYRNR